MDDDDIEFDTAVIFGDEEPYDLEAAVNSAIAALANIVNETDPKSHAVCAARCMEIAMIASVALAHANGISEESFGDAIVESWSRYEADTDGAELN